MGYIDNRLRHLLEQSKLSLANGTLTTAELKQICIESLAYTESAAADIRMLLGGLRVEQSTKAEMSLRLNQALRVLDISTNYD